MKIIVATDSFKGSLTSIQAGEAIREGILKVYKKASVKVCSLADGGEGTAETIIGATGGKMITASVTGPLGKKVQAQYGIFNETAVIEIASAAGLTLITQSERNPLYTTTYGVGELILDAMSKGCREFIIGLGGSATNDGGVGMLQALGFSFLNSEGKNIGPGANGLSSLTFIKGTDLDLSDCKFYIACDVENPLCGKNGASYVYGPQKGATPESVEKMDMWLASYGELTKKFNVGTDPDAPGAGAAGGLGFAFMSYLHGEFYRGTDLVIKITGLEDVVKDCDMVITGEGRLDGQSVMGKAPMGVARLGKKYGKPVIAFAGSIGEGAELCNDHGIDAFFSVVKGPCAKEDAMAYENAYKNLQDTVEQVFRLIDDCKGR